MKAKTDQGPAHPNSEKPDYIQGLFNLMKMVSGDEVLNKFETDFDAGSIRYGDFKKELAEGLVRFIAPIRERILSILNDEKWLSQVIEQGASRARTSAKATLLLVKQAMGLNYF